MNPTEDLVEYVTATIGGQLFGLPIARVQEVFVPEQLTRVPLAGEELACLLNVRGRVLAVVDMRRRLGFQPQESGGRRLAIGIEHSGECYGLLIDRIGEVLQLPASARENVPVNLDSRLARVAAGVHRLASSLMVVLDVDHVLEFGACAKSKIN